MSGLTVRPLGDGETPPGRTNWTGPPGGATLVSERDGSVVACGTLDPAGSVTQASDPAIRLVFAAETADPERDLRPLVAALLEAAGATGGDRVVIGWDPMDHPGLRMLEGLGFAPTGTMPYFELGPGHVDFVSGYQDASGSILDLARPLP